VLTEAELDAYADLVEELSRWAIDRIVAERPRTDQIATKTTDADWVTETDLAVERHVREAISVRFPGDAIVGEEYGATGTERPRATWYIDPVDGTTNFVHALPWSSFSIAVTDDDGVAIGAVADPYRREVLSAVRGRGAQRDGAPIRCSDATDLVGGIFLTELTMQSLWEGQTELMQALAERGCVTRIMGSNALSLASVGAARASATLIGGFNLVDCQAGTLIAREAGAVVRSTSGSHEPVLGEGILVAAPGVADEVARLWQEAAVER
jgi:myo-inositol-1(or 4)-monophosphatase